MIVWKNVKKTAKKDWYIFSNYFIFIRKLQIQPTVKFQPVEKPLKPVVFRQAAADFRQSRKSKIGLKPRF